MSDDVNCVVEEEEEDNESWWLTGALGAQTRLSSEAGEGEEDGG